MIQLGGAPRIGVAAQSHQVVTQQSEGANPQVQSPSPSVPSPVPNAPSRMASNPQAPSSNQISQNNYITQQANGHMGQGNYITQQGATRFSSRKSTNAPVQQSVVSNDPQFQQQMGMQKQNMMQNPPMQQNTIGIRAPQIGIQGFGSSRGLPQQQFIRQPMMFGNGQQNQQQR